jgi:hypothetical protein
MADQPKELKIVFEAPPGYQPVFVTDVWGGPTPAGNIEMNFCIDRRREPESVTYSVGPSGLGRELRREPPQDVIERCLRCAIMMDLEHARGFAGWLQQTIHRMDELKRAGTPPPRTTVQ